jgi:pyruvate/2-oxoglutarate dehydrogenase complex dihydrolipoamide dehydrogenase (E3) component
MMEEIIASGQADVIYMARSLLADPYLPWKVMGNREDEIIHCMRCYTCMVERGKTKTRRCALNPVVGREIEGLEIQPAPKPQKVLVAGGGPGGMEAALIAAQRGHKTILCEKTERLGGIPNCEEGVPFKEAMFGFAKTMGHLLRKEGVEIRLNTPVTAAYADKENADVLICAVGSEPLIPPLPGIDGENVILVNDLPARRKDIGQNVIILGGGLAGCETAVHLADEGKFVIIVEMRDTLAPDANQFQGGILLERLRGRVETKLGYKGIRISDAGLYCMSPEGKETFISADTVLLATGQRSRRKEADTLQDAAPRVYQIGDCVAPKDMTAAIYQGYHAAMDA